MHIGIGALTLAYRYLTRYLSLPIQAILTSDSEGTVGPI